MKPLHTMVALCLIATIRALPQNSGKLYNKSSKEVFPAFQTVPGVKPYRQRSFEGCFRGKGCTGNNGRVIERFGNLDRPRVVVAANTGNQFRTARTFSNDVFQGGKAFSGAAFNARPVSQRSQNEKGKGFQPVSFKISSFNDNKREINVPKKLVLNSGVKFGQSGFQAQGSIGSKAAGFGGAQGASFGANAGQGSFNAGSSRSSRFSSSSSSRSTGLTGSRRNDFGAVSSRNGPFGPGAPGGLKVLPKLKPGALESGSAFNKGGLKFGSSFANRGLAGNKGGISRPTGLPRPLTTSTAATTLNFNQNTQISSKFGQQQRTNVESVFQSTGKVNIQVNSGGSLQQTCAGQGYVCVQKAQCINGVVKSNDAAALQAKTSKQYCNIETEFCCRIEPSNLSSVGLATFQRNRNGDVFDTGIIQTGCAAALKCTPVEFCTANGTISNTSVALSRNQGNSRIPLTDCKNIETGSIGKCCRDPYYIDPWPANQLGSWVPDVFGGNDGKYTPDNRNGPNNRPVTGRPPVSGGVPRNVIL